jgi:methyl-accepting chemotaxis protein
MTANTSDDNALHTPETARDLQQLIQVLQPMLEDFHSRRCHYQRFEKMLYLIGTTVLVVSIYVFYLIYIVSVDLELVTYHLESIATDIAQMSGNIDDIKTETATMKESVTFINRSMRQLGEATQQISHSVQGVQSSLEEMNLSIQQVSNDMTNTQKSMLQVSDNLESIHQDFKHVVKDLDEFLVIGDEIKNYTRDMSYGLGIMAGDVGMMSHDVSKPFRNFNEMVPW